MAISPVAVGRIMGIFWNIMIVAIVMVIENHQ
jgi:hypothetical protein